MLGEGEKRLAAKRFVRGLGNRAAPRHAVGRLPLVRFADKPLSRLH